MDNPPKTTKQTKPNGCAIIIASLFVVGYIGSFFDFGSDEKCCCEYKDVITGIRFSEIKTKKECNELRGVAMSASSPCFSK